MIDKLEFIIALAREQHFGRAAEVCNVSQPTLSSGIKQLEDQFGVLLVQRGSRFHGFTPEGDRVLEWARRIVADARAMRQDVDALKRGLAGHVRIAAIPTTLAMVEALTTPYRTRHPHVLMPAVLADTLGLTNTIRSIPIVDPDVTHEIGLVVPHREPMTPLIAALVAEAQRVAITLDRR